VVAIEIDTSLRGERLIEKHLDETLIYYRFPAPHPLQQLCKK
jgi:hypothetical protein